MSTSTKQINLFTSSNNAVSVGYKNYNAKKCLEQLNKFDRITTHIKIFSKLLIEQNSWFSKKCKLSWRLKGTSFSRIYIHFYSSILNIETSNNGLLPTPQAMDVRSDTRKPEERSDAANKGGCSNLREWAANGMLPRPTSIDGNKNDDMVGASKMLLGAKKRNSGNQIQKTLTDAVKIEVLKENYEIAEQLASKEYKKRTKLPSQIEFVKFIKSLADKKELSEITGIKLSTVEHWFRKDKKGFSYPTMEDWFVIKKHYKVSNEIDYKMTYEESVDWIGDSMLPTPNYRDYKGNSITPAHPNGYNQNLPNEIKLKTGLNSQLNPRFVAEMMGFPTDWTELPFINKK